MPILFLWAWGIFFSENSLFRERVRGSNFAVRVLCALLINSAASMDQVDLREGHGRCAGSKWSKRILVKMTSFQTGFLTNPGTTPITVLEVNSDRGLSFAGEETRTMV